jgi:mannitol-1-/sugar-/sorbitol-6-phosphatase
MDWWSNPLWECSHIDQSARTRQRSALATPETDTLTAPADIFDTSFDAFLFDMDGTILNSIAAAERIWGAWAQRHGLDVATFLPTIHGVKGAETISRLGLPGVDAKAEAKGILDAEMADLEGILPIPGAIEFLNSLPPDRWAVVTSAPRELALKRMDEAGIMPPDVLIAGQDVENGKPHPDCFMLGARKLGFGAKNCLVFEDAVAGILAGEGAGASIAVITATHHHPMETALATLPDYTNVRAVTGRDGKLSLKRLT